MAEYNAKEKIEDMFSEAMKNFNLSAVLRSRFEQEVIQYNAKEKVENMFKEAIKVFKLSNEINLLFANEINMYNVKDKVNTLFESALAKLNLKQSLHTAPQTPSPEQHHSPRTDAEEHEEVMEIGNQENEEFDAAFEIHHEEEVGEGSIKYSCSFCTYKGTRSNTIQHMGTCDRNPDKPEKQKKETDVYQQLDKKVFKCKQCGKQTFTTKFIVLRHIKTVHDNIARTDRGPPKKKQKQNSAQ